MADAVQYRITMQQRTTADEEGGLQLLGAQRVEHQAMEDADQYWIIVQQRTIAAEEGGPQLLGAEAVDVAPRIQVVQQQQHQVQRRVHAHLGPQRHAWTPCKTL